MQAAAQTVTGRVYALKNIRIILTKTGRMKFASHLDMNRLMSRIVRRSGIPIWYTEGYNQHPYLTFALPLSLGFTSDYEVLDIKLTDDEYSYDDVKKSLNSVLPDGLEVVSVGDCIKKPGEIAYAEFKIMFESTDEAFAESLKQFLSQPSIVTEKKTKKGKFKEIDMVPFIKDYTVTADDSVCLDITLAAGGENNLNPTLLLSAYGELPYYTVHRKMIYDKDMECFK